MAKCAHLAVLCVSELFGLEPMTTKALRDVEWADVEAGRSRFPC